MRRFTLAAMLATTALGVLACQEDLLAPGAGTCPAYCPPEQLSLVDSILIDAVTSDTSFTGYVLAGEASGLQLVADSGGALPTSRVVLRFLPYAERLLLGPGDTTTGAVLGLDSFDLRVAIQTRGDSGLELRFHRLPATIDPSATFAGVEPYFHDSTRIGTLAIPDSVQAGAVNARFAADAFPTLEADGRIAAVGIELRAVERGFVTLASVEAVDPPILTRYVRLDSAGVTVSRLDGKLPGLDTFLGPDLPATPGGVLRVGGSPSARALLRFAVPAQILDSSTIVRATLILVGVEPAIGAPGDTVQLIAQGVAADVGAKSPLVGVAQEDLLARLVPLAVGASDTARFDITSLVLRWAADTTRARAIMVRAVPEGNAFAEGRFGSSASAGARPALQLTYVPPLRLGGR